MDGNELILIEPVRGKDLIVRGLLLAEGLQISICGGERPHIGAVSIVGPDGTQWDMEFPGHRDGSIARKWAAVLGKAGYRPVVVEAGIHYDNLDRAGIESVLAAADRLLAQLQDMLVKAKNPPPSNGQRTASPAGAEPSSADHT